MGAGTTELVAQVQGGITWMFRVRTVNADGESAWVDSAPPVFVSPTKPGAPRGVSAVAGDESATVSWTAPADDGGSPITYYSVNAYEGDSDVVFTTVNVEDLSEPLSVVVPGLTNGSAYRFDVAA